MEKAEYEIMRRAEDAHWWYLGLRDLVARTLRAHVPPGGRVLDAGCGTGGNMAGLPNLRSVGIDASNLALSLAQQRGLSNLVRASIVHPPFKDGVFDAVICLDVLYYCERPDDLEALSRMRALLKPGGILLLQVPAFEALSGQHDKAVHVKKRYTKSEVRHLLVGAGYQVERLTHRNAFLFPAVLAKRQAERLFAPKGPPRSDVHKVSGPLNRFLKNLLLLENQMIQWEIPFPAGVSLFAVARSSG
jgi:SAM-dependent methyltransferase